MQRISLGYTLVLAAIGAALLSVPTSSQTRRIGRFEVETIRDRDAVAREALVKLRDPLQPDQLAQLASLADSESIDLVGRSGILRIRSKSQNAARLLALLSNAAGVSYVEPNFIVRTFAEPNDPNFPHLWGLKNIGQSVNGKPPGIPGADIDSPHAWDMALGTASNVVAVVDTGIDYTHPDLAPNVWSAPSAFTVTVGGSAITCAAGTHGFNAILRTCDPMDDHNHGTHVSGTIGAVGNNGAGVSGVNWVASIMGLKFLDASGSGTTADAIAALEFAVGVKQAFAATGGANIRVLSNSWGGGDFSQLLLDQINAAAAEDMLFVAAAGNSGLPNDIFPTYPASYNAPSLIAVAATTNTDARASFSNYGANTVHLGAPGVDILSTIRDQAFGFSSGTSMATPHVSGAAALVLSQCLLDTAQLRSVLLDTVDPVSGLAGRVTTGGRLNAYSALRSCSAPPDAPASLTAAAGDKQVALAWSAAAGALSYRVKRSTTAGGPYAVIASNVKGVQYVDAGLTAGTTYYYVVSAANTMGESGNSPQASATPTELPSDLVVYSFLVPSIASPETPLSVSVTTRNQGTGLSYATTTRFYVSTDTVVDPSDPRIEQAQAVPMLAPNTSSAATIGLTIPSMPTGTYYLIAKADADGLLLESQEGNNTRARVIYIGPDLVVTSLTGPSGVVPGMPMTLNYTVGNSGGVTAPLSSLRFFWSSNSSLDASDTLLGSQNVGPVAGAGSASGQVTVTTPANATIGNFYVIAEADSTKVIPETQETNNTASLVVRIGGDLTVSAVTAPSSLGAGLSYSFGDTTKNEGGVQVGATVTQFYLSTDSVLSAGDPLIGSRPVAALGPGVSNAGTANVTIPPGTLAGSYYLFAKADGTNAVSESLETNNTASRTVTIGPDLTADIDLVTSPVAAGAQAQVKESTTNRGGAATGAFNIGYYLSVDFYLDAADVRLAPNRTISSLAVGATNFGTTLVTIPQGTAPGWYYLIVKADADGAVGESSETNNTWPRSVRVE